MQKRGVFTVIVGGIIFVGAILYAGLEHFDNLSRLPLSVTSHITPVTTLWMALIGLFLILGTVIEQRNSNGSITTQEPEPDVTLEFSNKGPFTLRNFGGTACEVRIECADLNEGQLYEVSFSMVPDLHNTPVIVTPEITPSVLLSSNKDIMNALNSIARGRALRIQDPTGVRSNSAVTDRLVSEMLPIRLEMHVSYTDRHKSKRWQKRETLVYDPGKAMAHIEHAGKAILIPIN